MSRSRPLTRVLATIATLVVLILAGSGCDTDANDDSKPGPHRDKQGRLQLQDDPALDGLNPEKDCRKYPELEACKIYFGEK